MKKSLKSLRVLMLALLVPFLAGNWAAAQSSQVSFVSVTATWHDAVSTKPSETEGQPVITNGTPTSIIRWGVTDGDQSGYDYTVTVPVGSTTVPGSGSLISLGAFTHRNFPVSGPSLKQVQLDISVVLDVDGVVTGPLTFTYTFLHDETENDANPCPYPTPTGQGCTDSVTIVAPTQPTTLKIGGVDYTLQLGFLQDGSPVTQFVTAENAANAAGSVGQFVPVPPVLTMSKSGPATMSVGQSGLFTLNIQNTASSEAWNAKIVDRLPSGTTSGMCNTTPVIQSAQVFQADGVTPVSGKPVLVAGKDYSFSYVGFPTCQLTLTMLSQAGMIDQNQRLIITYNTQLDATSQTGATLTNIAGAVQWFNGDTSATARQSYTGALTDGTVGTLDSQDAHTVTVAAPIGTYFEKSVMNLRSGANPATVAAPGDTLRYTLTVQTTGAALNNFSIYDELDALNTPGAFTAGTLSLVSPLPSGAVNTSSATGGSKGTGLINISNLNLAANSLLTIQFDIKIATTSTAGSIVSNQGQLLVGGVLQRRSDDPNVNGKADPLVSGNEDPTRVTIVIPAVTFQKTVASGTTAHPGDVVRYRLQLKNTSSIPISSASLTDDIDQLNSKAMFVPGTLTLVTTLPAGATNSSNASGGSKSTGLLDIRNLNIGAAGAADDTLTLDFTVQLVPVIANGTVVLNQAQTSGVVSKKSDDPTIAGTEDPTRLVIQSAPVFRVLKTSEDTTGDAQVLRQGDTLHYTITIKNVGNDDTTDAVIRDPIPANTTYVVGSTRLNGTVVPDNAGVSPLVNGLAIDAPQDLTPGVMHADVSSTTANVATVTFDVTANAGVVDGAAICNQAFVSSQAHSIFDIKSDNPNTSIVNDATCRSMGNMPLIYAEKKVALQSDLGTPGVVDPGDTLRYTITIYNTGNVAATSATMTDAVPANTTYVANSVTLNGVPVGQPDGGVSPLISGVNVSSSDLTPPVPGAGQGKLSPGKSAVLQFDVRVNDGVPGGTIISNQASVHTLELPVQPSDGDGDASNGNQPTLVVVGSGQQLSITKQVSVVGGGAALAGSQLEYLVTVTNISSVAVSNTVITDDLNSATPGALTYVNSTATLNGLSTGVTFAGSVLTADYYATYGSLQPGQTAVLRFRATLSASLANGTKVTNTAVVKWSTPQQSVSASVSIDVGGIAGEGILSGTVWLDSNFNKTLDSNERKLEGWTVELYRNGQVVYSVLTDSAGAYRISSVTPNYGTSDKYELHFTRPGAGTKTAKLGKADSIFTNNLQRISDIVVQSGSNLENLNLTVSPNGVIYDSTSRATIAGATVRMLDAHTRTELPASCFDDPAQQNQVTLSDGWYRFDIGFSDASCPSGGDYLIDVTVPSGGSYLAGSSQIIPPKSDASTVAFSVPACPGSASDVIPATAQFCEVQTSESAPAASVAARSIGTNYYVRLKLDNSQTPGSSQIFNNHIPLDQQLTGAITISKTTPLLNVSRGQLVPYVITVNNVAGQALTISIVDNTPAGFAYVQGSAMVDGVSMAPTVSGRQLTWSGLSMTSSQTRTLKLLLVVGAGVSEGEYVNHAQAVNSVSSGAMSGDATATVRVVADPTFDCTDVIGKVFNDANRNGGQDQGEQGLAGVRVVTVNGLQATTDRYGRYHITCAIVPNENRGSNFVVKIDDRTLPSGFRVSTDPLQIQRATAGKALKIDFGASIHRVVSIDLSDAVFAPGTTEIRAQWQPRLKLLLDELSKAPAALRLSYIADTEDAALVGRRLETVKGQLTEAWNGSKPSYILTIEPEVFWRRGGPPKRPGVLLPEGK